MNTLLIALVCLIAGILATDPEIEKLVNEEGHLKELGVGRPMHSLEETDGFPFTKSFFKNYVQPLKPLIMKNAAKLSPAFERWTDEYFLKQNEPADHKISIELKKKENRTFGVDEISFKEFVKVYNDSDIYMVNGIPPFIASDVILPGPLQCEALFSTFIDAVMWFSSGGTKSVVHTDSVDNINCLFRGEKLFLFIDPAKYGDKVDIDHPEGAYSDVDVDRVDFTKYPGLAEIEYYKVIMKPGDCLYIPYKWIHHVRSEGSNIAVNVWWDHFEGISVNLDQCQDRFDPDMTMDKVKLKGFSGAMLSIAAIRDHFAEHTRHGAIDFDATVKLLLGNTKELDEIMPAKDYLAIIKDAFLLLDKNRNNKIEHQEIMDAEDTDWEKIMAYMDDFDKLLAAMERKWKQADHGEEDIKDEAVEEDGHVVDEL